MKQSATASGAGWARAHRTIGYLFIAVFLGTGVYMRATLPPPEQDDMGERMSRRAIHVYILMSALLNVVASRTPGNRRQDVRREKAEKIVNSETSGSHPPGTPIQTKGRWTNRLALTGSILLLLSPPIFLIAFFVDPAPNQLAKSVSIVGAFATLIGSILIERTRTHNRLSDHADQG